MQFFLISWRRLLREKFYALVCVLSLAIGIAGSILISLYLLSELSFDHHHLNHERIYRLSTELSGTELAQSGYEIGPLVVSDYPQYLDTVRLRDAYEAEFTLGDVSNSWEEVFYADPSIFDIFTINPVLGDSNSALLEPFSIALSESMAEYYFADRDPIGETLSTEQYDFRVTLVFEDLPENVSQPFDALLPFDLVGVYRPHLFDSEDQSSWGDRFVSNYSTYFYVANGFEPESIEEISRALFTAHISAGFGQATGGNSDLLLTHHLQKLSDIRFGRQLVADSAVGNFVNVIIFAAVMVALLLSSCINYVNLATARAAIRSREVAIKKLLGAESADLIKQFLLESLFFVGIAFVLGIALAVGVDQLGIVEEFTGKSELGSLLLSPMALMLSIAAWIVIGVLSGIYPAIKLAQPSLLSVVGSQQQSTRQVVPLRQLLVWLQTTVAIVIVAWVLMMLRQSDFLLNAPLGFERSNRLVVSLQGVDEIRNRAAILRELRSLSGVINAAETRASIGRTMNINITDVETNTGDMENLTMHSYSGGPEYLETLGMELIEGDINRFYRPDLAEDAMAPLLVNETLVNVREWDQPIGKKIGTRAEVVGVVRDFHYLPMQQPISPLYLSAFSDNFLERVPENQLDEVSIDLLVHVSDAGSTEIRDAVREVIRRFSNQPIIEVNSLEDRWNELYDDESKTIGLVTLFAGLSIFISLLGLGGMAAYNNEKRAKEVAIRKVLGASVVDIQALLSLSLVKILLLASLPAFAAAWYLTLIWLQRFAYRVEPNAFSLITALLIVGVCSTCVLLVQTWRVAHCNPVEKLKYE